MALRLAASRCPKPSPDRSASMPCGLLWPRTPMADGALHGTPLADGPGRSGWGDADFHPVVNFAFTAVLRSWRRCSGADWILRGATRCPRIGGADPRQHGSSRGS